MTPSMRRGNARFKARWRSDPMVAETPFAFSVPTAIQFGDGVRANVADFLPESAAKIAFVRGGLGLAAASTADLLRERGLLVHSVQCGTEPSVSSVNAAVEALRASTIHAVVACGGGAVIDTGKAIAFCLSHGITLSDDFSEIPDAALKQPGTVPCIAIPTTAGTGAEVTANAVLDIPSKQAKISLRGRGLIPSAALVDPQLLPSAPASTALASGLDAVTQIIEAYTSAAATPFSDVLTRPNVDRGLRALKSVIETGSADAWRDLAWVSLCSGLALANSGLGAAHGLASVLGGKYGAPHGALCGRFLLPVLRTNQEEATPGSAVAERLAMCCSAIAQVFEPKIHTDLLSGFEAWIDAQGLPRLGQMGVQHEDFAGLAAQSAVASSSKKNAVELSERQFCRILERAF